MPNSYFWSRITTIYMSHLSSVVFAYTTAHFGPEFQVCTGPRLHLWFWAHMTACLTQEYKDYMCSSPRLWFCTCKTATLALELLVSVGPRPHLWFLHAKQRILDQNFKYLWVPALICGFCMPNSEFWPRITSLYGSQTSHALVCNQNGVICTRISSLYWFQPSSVVLCLQNSDFMTRLTSL